MHPLVDRLKRTRVADALRRNPLFYRDATRVLEQLDRMDLHQRRTWTDERLAEVLWTARRTGYGKRVRGTERLQSWPVLDKTEVQSQPRAFCSGQPWLAVSASTGGTSGAPLQLSRSVRSIAFEQACIDFLTRKLTSDAGPARCAVLRTEAVKDPNDFRPPYWVYAGGGERMVCSSFHLNGATVAAYAAALRAFQPRVLFGYPTSLEALCVLVQKCGETLHVPNVVCSSEVLHPHVWRLAGEQLGSEVLDYYGQAERVALAYAIRPGEYRFLPGYAHVELEPVGIEDGQQVCEIVGTGLWNLAMPLVRYRTGDLVHLPALWGRAELEEVALGLRSFAGVSGRDSDILLTPEGVKVTGLSHIHRDVRHIVRVQIVQESTDRVQLLVLAGPDYSTRDQEQLLHNARLRIPDSMEVRARRVDSLLRTALGKTPFVVHGPEVKALLKGARLREGVA